MSTRFKGAIAAGVMVAVVLVAIILIRRDAPSVSVTTAEVSFGDIHRQVLASGTLEPARTVDIGTEVSGTIAALPVDFNSIVHAGDVVVRLDPAQFQSALEAARAAEAQARADAAATRAALTQAQADYDRARALAGDDVVTRADLDAARATLAQTRDELKGREAAIAAAAAGVAQAQIALDKTVVRSPIDGIVVNRDVDVGQTVAAAYQAPTLLTIADLRHMQVLAAVDEGEVGGIAAGSPVTFHIDSMAGRTFHGTVSAVRLQPYSDEAGANAGGSNIGTAIATTGTSSGTVAATTATGTSGSTTTSTSPATTNAPAAPGAVSYTAVVDVDNSDERIAPGTTAVVTLAGGQRQHVLRIPNTVLAFRPTPEMLRLTGQSGLAIDASVDGPSTDGTERMHVWAFDDGRFVPIAIDTGLSDDHFTEIRGGDLRAGDQLVVSAVIGRR